MANFCFLVPFCLHWVAGGIGLFDSSVNVLVADSKGDLEGLGPWSDESTDVGQCFDLPSEYRRLL